MGTSDFEQTFGFVYDRARCQTVGNLNELPEDLLTEAKRLVSKAPRIAIPYLQYYVKDLRLDYASCFVDEVLVGGQPAQTWGVRDVLYICRWTTDYLELGSDGIASELAAIDGQRWRRRVPTAMGYPGGAGAPGVLVADAPYWEEPSSKRLDIRTCEDTSIATVELALASRRWMASCVAWDMRSREDDDTVAGICAALGLAEEQLSVDGRVAIEAFRKERRLAGEEGSIPGFVGPDEWYQL